MKTYYIRQACPSKMGDSYVYRFAIYDKFFGMGTTNVITLGPYLSSGRTAKEEAKIIYEFEL